MAEPTAIIVQSVPVTVQMQPGSTVALVPVGPRGPAGASGGGGSGGTGYEHIQSTPATVWGPIVHDLGYDPAGITVEDASGEDLEGATVQYLVAGSSLRLSFDITVSGRARLS